MVGIIDIGSNTIRLVMYENGKKQQNIAVNSEILADTKDGVLTQEGTQKLCKIMEHLKNEAKGSPVYAIATFAFRVLANFDEVKKEILRKTGVLVEVLSAKDEAICDFHALIREIGGDKKGIGADLGGGSSQIFSFSAGEIGFFDSYPIGAKKVKKLFMQNEFANEAETEKMYKYIRKYLVRVPDKSEILYMMGGTAKTALRTYNFMQGTQKGDVIEAKDIGRILEFIKKVPSDTLREKLRCRYDNIACGIMVMDEIAKQVGAEKIIVLPCGVREGYLASHKLL